MIKICHLAFLVFCDLAVSVQILLFLNKKKKKHKAKDNTRYLIDAHTEIGVLARQKPQRGGGGGFLRTPSVVKMQPKCIGLGGGPPTYTQSLFPGLIHNAGVHHQYARTSSVELGEGHHQVSQSRIFFCTIFPRGTTYNAGTACQVEKICST